MKYVDEYRQPHLVQKLSEAIHATTTRPWTIMEVCGGQTHSILKFGLHDLLPEKIRLIHGPGCPVCVTPIQIIDHAIHIAFQSNTIVCTFGDMLRVPGTHTTLLTIKAKGADVRSIYSPLEAVTIAEANPQKSVVLFAIGFETTAPANAMALIRAKKLGIKNFFLLASHVLVPPALTFLLQSPQNEIQGFLAAGHVCAITGYHQYHAIADTFHTPIVITGFEPIDILQGVYACIQQLEKNGSSVENQYQRCVEESGNRPAQEIVREVFTIVDREWRGIGIIPSSGLALREEHAEYDATRRFPLNQPPSNNDNGCISGLVLQGVKKPSACPFFATQCTPESPFGAPMVSPEGSCSAYYQYSMRSNA